MFSTVTGGEEAIAASHRLLKQQRRGDPEVAELSTDAIREQLGLAVDRVMAEGSLYAPGLAALAVKQAQGDLVEAAYLLRAYRATLPRIGESQPLDTTTMAVRRQISTTYKNIPGGQILGATYDYTHRLLDFSLSDDSDVEPPVQAQGVQSRPAASNHPQPNHHLVEASGHVPDDMPADITRTPLAFPASRDSRLQTLARGDEGFLAGLAYSTMRGYGRAHPFLSALKVGDIALELHIPEVGDTVAIGEIALTECEILNKRVGGANDDDAPRFVRGYGLAFGRNERKAMAMAVLDFTLRARELGDEPTYPAQDEEFVLSHADNIDASGMVQHLKLPHYVDFQAEVQSLEELRRLSTLTPHNENLDNGGDE
ncbi:carbon-phosphorus lyase complex subunit PhnI [Burkholderia cepacia]|uniref:carbon-phosphorus lyase complex subunit PhnI n=1 Tax=Burkholderia cepacia TaxID=292 RepID=UPI002AB6FD47|nr:carbon-phosphorus lyase complex subunit PhnI [Burkholderia cepacia]